MNFRVANFNVENKVPGSGVDTALDIDVKKVIDNIPYRTPITTMAPPGY